MLNVLNRVVTILALLGLVACAALVAVGVYLPTTLRDRAAVAVDALFLLPETMIASQQLITAVVASLLAVIGFVLLVLELRPPARDDSVQLKAADGSRTRVARGAIHRRVQYAVDRLDDVVEVAPTITGGGRGLTVHLDVTTSPHIDVPMKSEEIRAVTRDVIEKQMGLRVAQVTVKLDHDAYQSFESDVV